MVLEEIGLIALRGVAGGLGVLGFAAIGEAVRPKAFAGLFAAGPSVAVASLLVAALAEGSRRASTSSLGMIIGAVGMVVCCLVAVWLIPKLRALKATVVAGLAWLVVTSALYWAVFLA
jgi:hypothetical protein